MDGTVRLVRVVVLYRPRGCGVAEAGKHADVAEEEDGGQQEPEVQYGAAAPRRHWRDSTR